MRTQVRTMVSCVVVLGLISCAGNRSTGPQNQAVQENIEAYQRSLIARGVTGGSAAGVFRGGDTVAFSIVNSGLAGDSAISANTIFPICPEETLSGSSAARTMKFGTVKYAFNLRYAATNFSYLSGIVSV